MTNEKTAFPSDAADKYVVRFPDGMRDRIAAAAKENNRSMNAEIVARLQGSFEQAGQVASQQMIKEMRRTQLHLSMSSIASKLTQQYEEGKLLMQQAKTGEIDQIALESGLHSLKVRKKELDVAMSNLLGQLHELDRGNAPMNTSTT